MSASTPAAQRESLVRVIGTFGLAAGIINITIGGGIFRLPANVAGSGGGGGGRD
jgi:basic amino acid/polyamine antiporter, APA family